MRIQLSRVGRGRGWIIFHPGVFLHLETLLSRLGCALKDLVWLECECSAQSDVLITLYQVLLVYAVSAYFALVSPHPCPSSAEQTRVLLWWLVVFGVYVRWPVSSGLSLVVEKVSEPLELITAWSVFFFLRPFSCGLALVFWVISHMQHCSFLEAAASSVLFCHRNSARWRFYRRLMDPDVSQFQSWVQSLGCTQACIFSSCSFNFSSLMSLCSAFEIIVTECPLLGRMDTVPTCLHL